MTKPTTRAFAGRNQASKGAMLLALCLAALIINIDVTIVNVSLPSLVRQLGASTTNLQWVVDAYTLVFAALILTAGSLSDRFGRKGLLLTGLGVFAAGSLTGSLVHSVAALIAARAVMGVGAAAIFPSTLSLIANVFTERSERAKAIGLWGATTGVGVAAGPIVGGWLLGRFWWGSVFVLMVPLAAAVAGLVAWAVPTSRDPDAPPIDRSGLILSATGMGLLVLGIIQAPTWGWASTKTVTVVTASLAVLAAFVTVERRRTHPMLDVALFRNLRFTAASGSITIGFFTLAGFTFLVTQYFQFLKGYSPLGTGVRLLPVAAAIAVAALRGTRLAVRIGNKAVVATGLALFGAALMWISTNTTSTPYIVIAAQMILGGGGMGLITAPATEAILGVVPANKAGVGSAVNDATRLFGSALGVAVIGSVATSAYTSQLSNRLPAQLAPALSHQAHESVGGALSISTRLSSLGQPDLGGLVHHAATNAFQNGLTAGCTLAGTVAILGAIMAAALLPSRPGRNPSTTQPAAVAVEQVAA
jgi:EmrB/QacA subfamily drug resistance transporter